MDRFKDKKKLVMFVGVLSAAFIIFAVWAIFLKFNLQRQLKPGGVSANAERWRELKESSAAVWEELKSGFEETNISLEEEKKASEAEEKIKEKLKDNVTEEINKNKSEEELKRVMEEVIINAE